MPEWGENASAVVLMGVGKIAAVDPVTHSVCECNAKVPHIMLTKVPSN